MRGSFQAVNFVFRLPYHCPNLPKWSSQRSTGRRYAAKRRVGENASSVERRRRSAALAPSGVHVRELVYRCDFANMNYSRISDNLNSVT